MKPEPEELARLRERILSQQPLLDLPVQSNRATCPDGPHRGPAGPNEDIGQCRRCWSPMGVLRPEGETFGWHAEDCSLPARHPGHCVGGGNGHPPAETIRG